MSSAHGRRVFLLGAAAGALGMLAPAAATPPRPIPVRLKRFVFEPSTIRLVRGEAVVFELTSLDVPMGFNLPDFGLRSDVMPGTVARLPLIPDKSGQFPFLCDIFCGSGHESMSGILMVS